MKGDEVADRLARERPIRVPDGRWDVGVFIDWSSLAEGAIQEEAVRLHQAAQAAGLPVFDSWEQLGGSPVGTLFIVAHRDEKGHAVARLLEAGQAGVYRDRYVILAMCGLDDWQEAHELAMTLNRQFGAVGVDVVEWRIQLSVNAIYWLLRAFIQLGEAQPDLSPGIALNRARGIVLRAIEEATC
jgi:hypothetical protein